jgi:hypothetical protein
MPPGRSDRLRLTPSGLVVWLVAFQTSPFAGSGDHPVGRNLITLRLDLGPLPNPVYQPNAGHLRMALDSPDG